jgi:hypothetical protein
MCLVSWCFSPVSAELVGCRTEWDLAEVRWGSLGSQRVDSFQSGQGGRVGPGGGDRAESVGLLPRLAGRV